VLFLASFTSHALRHEQGISHVNDVIPSLVETLADDDEHDEDEGRAQPPAGLGQRYQKEYERLAKRAATINPYFSRLGLRCMGDETCSTKDCTKVEPIGCVIEDLRKGPSPEAFLSNEQNQICYFNSALIALFAGSNALVPRLTTDPQTYSLHTPENTCKLAVREELITIVRAMRNSNSLDKDKYAQPMMARVKSACWEYLGDSLEAVSSLQGSTAKAVMMMLLLPSLGVKWDQVDFGYSFKFGEDCNGTGVVACANDLLLAGKEKNPTQELLIFDFNLYRKAPFPEGFRFYDAPELVAKSGDSYVLMSGTAARLYPSPHNVAFTVHHGSGAPVLTFYDDSYGVFEYADIESGFNFITENFVLSTLIFVKKAAALGR
jgi:hypothetical protein